MKKYSLSVTTQEVINFYDRELYIPITITLMPYDEKSGKVVFNIDDDYLGSHSWANMGMPLKEFLATATPSYLVEKLFKKPYQVDDTDLESFLKFIYLEYKDRIKELLFSDEEEDSNFHDILRYAYDAVINNEHCLGMDFMYHNESTFDFFEKIFGSNWYEGSVFQKKINPEFIQLKEYIKAFQKAMKETFYCPNGETNV